MKTFDDRLSCTVDQLLKGNVTKDSGIQEEKKEAAVSKQTKANLSNAYDDSNPFGAPVATPQPAQKKKKRGKKENKKKAA